MESKELEARLDDMEMRLTFIDETVSSLLESDTSQTRRMLALEQLLDSMRVEMASMRQSMADNPQSEPPPPHY